MSTSVSINISLLFTLLVLIKYDKNTTLMSWRIQYYFFLVEFLKVLYYSFLLE